MVAHSLTDRERDDSTIHAATAAACVPSREIRYVHHPDFDDPGRVHHILEQIPDSPSRRGEADVRRLSGSDYRLPDRKMLTKEEERSLFLRMNLFRCLAARRLQGSGREQRSAVARRRIRNLLDQANHAREEIIESNQRLVIASAAKFLPSGVPMADLVSEANVALIRAVEGFDVSRNFRLSTYATIAISRHLNRYVRREHHRAINGGENVEPQIEDGVPEWIDVHPQHQVNEILAGLPERERQIMQLRFGLSTEHEPQTLHQLGQRFGLSKERIRRLILSACESAHRKYAHKLGFD